MRGGVEVRRSRRRNFFNMECGLNE